MGDRGFQRGDATDRINVQSIATAWAASSTVREFSGIHRTIRGLVVLFMPAVADARPADEKRTRALANAILFAVEGTRFHHSLEDDDYWPALIANGADGAVLDPLMAEHHELVPLLDKLDAAAEALRTDPSDEAALSSCKTLFGEFANHLLVHLDHEEPIFFPLLVEHLPEAQAHTLALKAAKSAPRKGFSWIMAGATYAMRPREAEEFFRSLPKPLVWSRPLFLRRYRKDCKTLGIDPAELSRADGI